MKGLNTPPSTSTNSQSKPRLSRPPGPTAAAKKMLPWIYKYFSNAAQDGGYSHVSPHCVVTAAPPLYLQYQGHSTTVIGIERRPPGSGGRTASPAASRARRPAAGRASTPRMGAGPLRTASQQSRKPPSGLGRPGLNTSARLPGQRSLPEVISCTGRRRMGPAEASPSVPARPDTPAASPRTPQVPLYHNSAARDPLLGATGLRSSASGRTGAGAGTVAPRTCHDLAAALQEDRSERLGTQNPLGRQQQPLSLMAGGLDLTAASDSDDEATALCAVPWHPLRALRLHPQTWRLLRGVPRASQAAPPMLTLK